jgi:hypothetical protein
MNMIRRLPVLVCALLVLSLQTSFAFAQGSVAAPALSFKETETQCLASVSTALHGKTVSDSVDVLRASTKDVAPGPCGGPPLQGIDFKPLLDAVQLEIAARHARYGCEANKALPVCEGLRAASARVLVMRTLVGGDAAKKIVADQTGLLNATDSLHWRREYLSFGVSSATGVSFLKLVLRSGQARGSALEQSVNAETDWEAFKLRLDQSAEAKLTCDDLCADGTAQVLSLYALFSALDVAFQPSGGELLDVTAKKLQATRERWDAYHFGGGDARVQLPWELALNGVIFNANRPLDAEGHYAPFPPPPNYAVTFIHPSVGLALKDTKGADSSLVGVVEVLGFSRWTYAEDNTRSGEWGLSLIAAYQPRDNDRDWGYGVLARLPWRGINVAWTRTDLKAGGKDDQFLISIDVSKYLGGGAGDIAKLFKLQDPGK